MLRSRVLHRDSEPSGNVSHPHRTLRLINVLSTGSPRPHNLNLDIPHIQNLIRRIPCALNLRENQNCGRRSMHPALGLGNRNTLNTMNASFRAKRAVDFIPARRRDEDGCIDDALGAGIERGVGQYLPFPAPLVDMLGVHFVQVEGEYSSVVAADSALEFHDAGEVGVRVSWDEGGEEFSFEGREVLGCLVEFVFCEGDHFVVVAGRYYALEFLHVLTSGKVHRRVDLFGLFECFQVC